MENDKSKDQIIVQPKEWLDSAEAAEFLGISIGTLRNLTSNGHVPYYKFRSRNRYKASELNLLIIKKGEEA